MYFFMSWQGDVSGKNGDLYGLNWRTESYTVKSTYWFKGRNELKKNLRTAL